MKPLRSVRGLTRFGVSFLPLLFQFFPYSALAAGGGRGGAVAENRAYFGMVVASKSNIRKIVFKAGDGTVYARKNIGSGTHLVFFGLKSGSYCMTRVHFWRVDVDLRSYGKDVCFPAIKGVIGYIGHYIFAPYDPARHAIRFDRVGDFRARMGKRYPGLLNRFQVMDLLDLQVTLRVLDAPRAGSMVGHGVN